MKRIEARKILHISADQRIQKGIERNRNEREAFYFYSIVEQQNRKGEKRLKMKKQKKNESKRKVILFWHRSRTIRIMHYVHSILSILLFAESKQRDSPEISKWRRDWQRE